MKIKGTAKLHTAMIIFVVISCFACVAQADLLSGASKAAGRVLTKIESRELAALAVGSEGAAARLVQEIGEEGAEAFLKTLSPAAKELMALHGERGAEFFLKTGPTAEALLLKHGDGILRVFASVGENTAAWAAKYGDEGVRAANRFGVATTEELVGRTGMESLPVALHMGYPALSVLKRNPEALSLLQAAAKEGSEKTLLSTIERGGDRFFQFAQRNWKGISVATLCCTFMMQPEAFTKPAGETIKEIGKTAIERITDLLKETAKTGIKRFFDSLTTPQSFEGAALTYSIIATLGLGGLWMILGYFRQKREKKEKMQLQIINQTPLK